MRQIQDRSIIKGKERKKAIEKQILDDIVKGLTFTKIVEKLHDVYGLSKKDSKQFVYTVIEDLKDVNEDYISNIRDINNERLQQLLFDNLNSGDAKSALEVIKEINKMNGLYIEKIELGGNTRFNFSFDTNGDTTA